MKMFRGENRYGHTAPYPEEIPELLLSLLANKGTVLDPFSGSMTTGRVAYRHGFKSVNIEIHQEYCELGPKLFEKNFVQSTLF